MWILFKWVGPGLNPGRLYRRRNTDHYAREILDTH